MYYLERKTEELERQGKKVEGKKSKPRGPNYEWTFDDNCSALATKISNRQGSRTKLGPEAQYLHRLGH